MEVESLGESFGSELAWVLGGQGETFDGYKKPNEDRDCFLDSKE